MFSPRYFRYRCCRCCPWRPVARGFERVAATIYGDIDDDEDELSDFGEEPTSRRERERKDSEKDSAGRSKQYQSSQEERREEAMNEMFVEFFDAIDDLSDNEMEGTTGMGLGLVIPKLKTDGDLAWEG
eukprot:Skav203979  [mRNA]  locus=scaffold94:761447:764423:- [translate_table: standard]